jgi:hypothetical protein
MDKRSMTLSLRAARDDHESRIAAILADSRGRTLTAAESVILADQYQEVDELSERIAELEEQVRADEAAAEVARRYAPRSVRHG